MQNEGEDEDCHLTIVSDFYNHAHTRMCTHTHTHTIAHEKESLTPENSLQSYRRDGQVFAPGDFKCLDSYDV